MTNKEKKETAVPVDTDRIMLDVWHMLFDNMLAANNNSKECFDYIKKSVFDKSLQYRKRLLEAMEEEELEARHETIKMDGRVAELRAEIAGAMFVEQQLFDEVQLRAKRKRTDNKK